MKANTKGEKNWNSDCDRHDHVVDGETWRHNHCSGSHRDHNFPTAKKRRDEAKKKRDAYWNEVVGCVKHWHRATSDINSAPKSHTHTGCENDTRGAIERHSRVGGVLTVWH